MYLIKTYIDKSTIHGTGVFAGEDIRKGAVVSRHMDMFDRTYTPDEVKNLPKEVLAYLEDYGYGWKGTIRVPADNDRFTNHAEDPNTRNLPDGDVVALRDIKKGEELTTDYRLFDKTWWDIFPDDDKAVAWA